MYREEVIRILFEPECSGLFERGPHLDRLLVALEGTGRANVIRPVMAGCRPPPPGIHFGTSWRCHGRGSPLVAAQWREDKVIGVRGRTGGGAVISLASGQALNRVLRSFAGAQ